jgi:hypothetical protein
VKPYPQFLYALAMPYSYVVAQEAVAHFGPEFLKTKIVIKNIINSNNNNNNNNNNNKP